MLNETLNLDSYPNLKLLFWDRIGLLPLCPKEQAFDIIRERVDKYLDIDTLTENENLLLEEMYEAADTPALPGERSRIQ